MQFGIIIQARLNSKRLPNKILKKINNTTILEILINRLLKCFKRNTIVIATTKKKEDSEIIKVAKKLKVNFFRGSENNLLLRYICTAKKFAINNIIRITSDCPLVDPFLIKKMKNKFLETGVDYLSNTLPAWKSKFPNGSDIEIFTYKSLIKAKKLAKTKVEREHVTNVFWNSKRFNTITFKGKKNYSHYKYCLDYKSDFNLIKMIIKALLHKKKFGTYLEIIKIIKNNKKMMSISTLSNKKFFNNRNDLRMDKI
ncbi:SpsF Spore coat polysaccharide biosynthesis protein F, CMP-KDO synthetase homolog [Candidatus Pelagibacterales bacterium]|jgi:spore coat polysaccharide biosynthesis protein SpsF